ncbi:probable carboxylesterase 17 [Amborella trichopoda]|nr:probable carboxylesterase 17 [Amborella trichopoda]|eukprot:XP_006826793.2 probable carboxylesterase 17 [Amborella trichopoda]
MRRRRMGLISLGDSKHQIGSIDRGHGSVIDEIPGLIRVYKDGHVYRYPVVQESPCTIETGVSSRDFSIDCGLWARFYVPNRVDKPALLIYFHGGGFCVGSAAWKCYHEFLSKLAVKSGCVIMSVNYRLAPEHPLPAAYDDGFVALTWAIRRVGAGSGADDPSRWLARCDSSRVFLAGDSAGANIAHHVMARHGSEPGSRLSLRGTILIQPFFGGEPRTDSEKHLVQPPDSALTLATSDTYWRLALPPDSSRDHFWCNPLSSKSPLKLEEVKLPAILVCVSENDILKDRDLGYCEGLRKMGKKVQVMVYGGVGHAFQVLHNSPMAGIRTLELISHVANFINS